MFRTKNFVKNNFNIFPAFGMYVQYFLEKITFYLVKVQNTLAAT